MKKLLLFCSILLFTKTYAQPPAGYYSSATGTGYTLKTQLYNIIKNHTVIPYSSLYACFEGTYNGNATDKKPNGKVWDMYSDIPNGTPPYEFNWSQKCGTYNAEGQCFNREHSFPQSWFNSQSPMQSDLFHVYPTDGYVNNKKSNYPFGTVSAPTWTSQNGSKLGPCSFPGYTGIVFEPRDEYKGDFARSYFYMATRYENVIASWQSNGTADNVLNGTSTQVFDTWHLNLLYQWHVQDPVSAKEIARNNAVYSIQGNRNPFIDHPEWVAVIWGFAPPTPQVSFSAPTSTVQEPNSGTITHIVNVVVNTTANNPFSVNVSVSGVGTTASTPADFTLLTTSLTFTGSETIKSVQILIQSDGITEPDETIRLTLSSPTNGVGLGTSTHNITLRDVSAASNITETFDPCNNLNTWTQFSVTGAQTWQCTTYGRNSSNGVQMNGYSGSPVVNEDWLISPPLNLSATSKMSYWSRTKFNGNSLQLKISTNYTGTGNPNSATWVNVPGATFPAINSDVWTETANVDLSAFAGTNRYIAFVYTSTASAAARWTLDDISFTAVSAPSSPTPTINVSGSLVPFGNVNFGSASSIQTFSISGSNLQGNVTVEAPESFQVSKDGSTFANSITFVAGTDFTLPTMTPKTIHVRFAPNTGVDGDKDGDITITTPQLPAPVGVYVEGTETGNGFAQIEFTGITSQAPKGQNTFIKLKIQPSTKRLTHIILKARLLNNTALNDFVQTPALQADTTFRINIPADATETAFFLEPKTENITDKGVEYTIISVGGGLGIGSQKVHRVDFTQVSAITSFDVENTVLYPVPAANEVFVRTSLQNYEVNITDMTGRVLKSLSNSPRTIQVGDLANGVYLINFTNARGNIVKKIVVKK
ncbi:MAG: endonuclease [Raineya sp.]|nr:endonuclease [Raineya sp.]